MKIQVLVATMNQKDHSLLEKMHLRSDAIIGNQCDRNSIESFIWQGYSIKYLNFAEKGVGLNRNNALMRADADICLFADDDMVFYDGYCDTVIKAFNKNTDADVIIFNIDEDFTTKRRKNKETIRIGLRNYMNYGAARIVVRRKSILYNGISFNICFGGGTDHSCGEDTLFLRECLRKGLNVYAVPLSIAKLVNSRESTWFKGYTEKYFFDVGIILGLAHPFLCHLIIFVLVFIHKDFRIDGHPSIYQTLEAYERGIQFVKKRKWNDTKR